MENYASVMEEKPVVQTTHGKVRGENRNGIAVFRGIPYGGACDGKRRFLPAEPAADWEGVYDATKNGPIAMQFGTSISGSSDFGKYFSGGKPELFGCEYEVQSENCLVLNVLTPGLDKKERPVVVYIHGGGFASGSGTLVLGSDKWCSEEDIVVVGINHRLNVFGALYLGDIDPAYAQSGSAGILDCVLALEWVRDNIRAFGGNPENVTIMGESGGGGKVNDLLVMKKAKGLFHRAIVESGSGAPGVISREEASQAARALLKELGIKETELYRLQNIPAQDILDASARIGGYMNFSPIGDDIHIPYNPEKKFPEIEAGMSLLVGASLEETAAFADPKESTYSWEDLKAELLSQVEDRKKEEVDESASEKDEKQEKLWSPKIGKRKPGEESLSCLTEEKIDSLIHDFRKAAPQADPQHILHQIKSQGSFLGGGAYQQALATVKAEGGKVYAYFITFQAPHPRHPEMHFAWHTADLPLQMRIVAYPECEEISRVMGQSWGAFIRSGCPETEKIQWPEFTEKERKTMVFGEEAHVEADPTAAYREATENNRG